MKNDKNVKFSLNNISNWWEIENRKTPIEYLRKLLQRPLICPLRTYGNSPLFPTGHRPFGAATLLSLHFFIHLSKQGIGYRWPCAILGWLVLCSFTFCGQYLYFRMVYFSFSLSRWLFIGCTELFVLPFWRECIILFWLFLSRLFQIVSWFYKLYFLDASAFTHGFMVMCLRVYNRDL